MLCNSREIQERLLGVSAEVSSSIGAKRIRLQPLAMANSGNSHEFNVCTSVHTRPPGHGNGETNGVVAVNGTSVLNSASAIARFP
jgi:hypothetical protein